MKKKIALIFPFLFFTAFIACSQVFTEILGRPTDHSVLVNLLSDQKKEFYLEYGTVSGVYGSVTGTLENTPGVPDRVELSGLADNTKYFYRIRYRQTGTGIYETGPERTFHTQRSQDSAFTFTVESDEHLYDKKGSRRLYQVCLQNQAKDQPDFMFSMGDNFGDDHFPYTTSSDDMKELHKDYVQYFGSVCHSVPLFICLGNHEGENNFYMGINPPENIAYYGTLWRKYYYSNPVPDGFYSGNTDIEPYGVGNPENYFSWTWGDALFVVLDVYRYQCDSFAKPKNWDWTLGLTQYNWLKNTLDASSAKYKFVFAHQIRGQGRGGALIARNMEWGGYEQDGTTWSFESHRPGWGKPIHQLFVDYGVNIFFHGHDHLFSREVLDGVIYQEVPMPSDSTYELGMIANADAYVSDKYEGSGHLRVYVSPNCVTVDFVRAYLPEDTLGGSHHNGEIAFSYSTGSNCPQAVYDTDPEKSLIVYPNPADKYIRVDLPAELKSSEYSVYNIFGSKILSSTSPVTDVSDFPDGVYILRIDNGKNAISRKVVIRH